MTLHDIFITTIKLEHQGLELRVLDYYVPEQLGTNLLLVGHPATNAILRERRWSILKGPSSRNLVGSFVRLHEVRQALVLNKEQLWLTMLAELVDTQNQRECRWVTYQHEFTPPSKASNIFGLRRRPR